MKRINKSALLISMILSVVSINCFALSNNNYENHIKDLCNCKSSIHHQEPYIQNVGNFFANFEGKVGNLYNQEIAFGKNGFEQFQPYNNSIQKGMVEFNIKQIERDCPCVYKTEGDVIITYLGEKQILQMEKLDYVFDSENQRLYYRLKCNLNCNNNNSPVYILGYECGNSCPILFGNISFFSTNDTINDNYTFSITGRNSFETEAHLKKISRISAYSK